ncbi:Piso0_000819 [Millerozyma farinosa CBS 7064]|uniref:Piso0_000819 protein n=1 Tax=Pichia sorbitophila (strain ATCC MYA-4447 / BCRC 22081 / CBS 7064 / NBRC 10061 / NRRL Y-12695) TaxID=559304 RepID=G8YQ55_PICSO|nr:Piso0_000819 [Millerozyma farinosa CBS 7064]
MSENSTSRNDNLTEVKADNDAKVSNSTEQKKGTKKPKKAKDPKTLTPEYIAEQRRLRQLRKEEKRSLEIEESKKDSNEFIKRELATTSYSEEEDGSLKIKVMTYNVLAQSLTRREMFPFSGPALKWKYRSRVLLAEIKYYDPDIMCLQELDTSQYNSYWRKEFDAMGYTSKYHKADAKSHGICILFKRDKFFCNHLSFVSYDKESSEALPAHPVTQNVGLLACLQFNPKLYESYPSISKDGIIIGTTHLYWHPFGTYERTRQSYVLLEKLREFSHTMSVTNGSKRGWYQLLAGDFNSQPIDGPYFFMTSKPVTLSKDVSNLLVNSVNYWLEASNETDEDEVAGGANDEDDRPMFRDPKPSEDEKASDNVQSLLSHHNSLSSRAISLYSVAYKLVDENNHGVNNDRDEPSFSNWAHAWRGLLDYIFVMCEWDGNEDCRYSIDSIGEVYNRTGVKVRKLLKLPSPEDMGPEPSGQPKVGQYPSDHLCLMAEIGLC